MTNHEIMKEVEGLKKNNSQGIKQLKVGQKISLGYAIALGIAFIGTAIGVILGEYYQRQAWEEEEHSQVEITYIYNLQMSLLSLRNDQQQLPALLSSSDEKFNQAVDQVQKDGAIAQSHWQKLKNFTERHLDEHHQEYQQQISKYYLKYQNTINFYLEALNQEIEEIQALDLSNRQQLQNAQTQLLEFSQSKIALQIDQMSAQLFQFKKETNQEYLKAEESSQNAVLLNRQIIILSMIISLIIAIFLSNYISYLITNSLQKVTDIAKKVTEEANFDQQVPVEGKDEVAKLATYFNLLIKKVKLLLEEQKMAAEEQLIKTRQLQKLLESQKQTAEEQLIQSEKMSALGQMLAGVAHEINNPINFIYGNLSHAHDYIKDLFQLVETYQQEIPEPPQAVSEIIEEIDLEFLAEDLPKIIDSMKLGAERTRQIALSLRNFSRLEESNPHLLDLHECIDSTLIILHNRIKKGIIIEKNYGNIPQIEGFAGGLYQVFMNLLSNAIDALFEKEIPQRKIIISTELAVEEKESVIVKIKDNGNGISTENQAKIFETFFTTKPRGIGTGLGLAITKEIILDKHHGLIDCYSQEGIGTEFTITLPMEHSLVIKSEDE